MNYPKTRDFDVGSLQLCLSGGAPVPAENARRWEAIIAWCREQMEGGGNWNRGTEVSAILTR